MNTREVIREKGRIEGRKEGIQQGVQQGIQQGMQQGIQQGVQQGIQQGMETVALNMLKRDFDISSVAEVTGLSEREIRRIIKNRDDAHLV